MGEAKGVITAGHTTVDLLRYGPEFCWPIDGEPIGPIEFQHDCHRSREHAAYAFARLFGALEHSTILT